MHSPLLGFNNNVKHRGRVFHIQTEDSGIKHPHVITHLFADGGRILNTKKTSYAQHIEDEHLADLVRDMMKQQHRAMFIALREGQFDHLLSFDDAEGPSPSGSRSSSASAASAGSGPSVVASAVVASAVVGSSAVGSAAVGAAAEAAPRGAAAASAKKAAGDAASPPGKRPAPPPRAASPVASAAPSAAASGAANTAGASPAAAAAQPSPLSPSRQATLLETPSAAVAVSSAAAAKGKARGKTPSVAPPARVRSTVEVARSNGLAGGAPALPLAAAGTKGASGVVGSVAVASAPAAVASAGPTTARMVPAGPGPRSVSDPSREKKAPASARFVASRPATGANSLTEPGRSIFGEDLISEKSLDEVILSYLSEDLDGAAGSQK